MADVASLLQRVEALEKKRFHCPHDDVLIDEQMRRARRDVEERKLYSTSWKWVKKDYYTWPLSGRAKELGAPSTDYLCKSLLMENRKAPEANDDPTNPRFVLVVLQYEATLDTKKLVKAIRALRPVPDRLDDSHFDIRIASEEDNAKITGYDNNAVVPFGLLSPVSIVLSAPIVPLRYFWMGGGHVHLKLRMTVDDFCKALKPIVADISQPRSPGDPEP